jgi:hypothetical protein
LTLLPTHGWTYFDIHKFNQKYKECTESVIGPVTQAELTIPATYEDPTAKKKGKCDIDDDFKDTSLLTEKGDLQMEDLFGEKDINQQQFKNEEKFDKLEKNFKTLILAKLNKGETIPSDEAKIIVNKSIAIKNMIDTKEDEENEGMRIVNFVKNEMLDKDIQNQKIFNGIKMTIFNGYVHLARSGIKVDDVINKQNVPELKYFKWQYGIPIDYDTLKYLLFQSEFQKKIKRDQDEQEEVKKIFSQEYLIALQPEPRYHMWVLKRLIMMWFADDILTNNIRKIKVIINQWRCRADQDFNQKYGVLPSIVIYPRYGKTSAKNVLQLISNYFMLYQSIGWSCSQPSYFIKVNDLIWYTNGSIDLKMYFTKSLGSYDGKSKNTSFNEYFSSVLGAEKLLYPF